MVMEFVIAAGIVGATIGGWMKLVRPLYHTIRGIIDNAQAAFDLLQAQLVPNGGGSLIDQVRAHGPALTKLSNQHEALAAQQTVMAGQQTSMVIRLDRIERALSDSAKADEQVAIDLHDRQGAPK